MKMVIKQLVLKKGSHYFFKSLVLLKDFAKTKLKITQHDYDCMFLSCHVHVFRVNPHSIVA